MISESCFLIYHNILDTAENYGLFVIENSSFYSPHLIENLTLPLNFYIFVV